MKDQIFYYSYGYDMTINKYCKVVEETPKTAKAVMIGATVRDDNGLGGGNSTPNPAVVLSAPFRLRKSEFQRELTLRGSDPDFRFSGSQTWWLWKGTPNYYNTWD